MAAPEKAGNLLKIVLSTAISLLILSLIPSTALAATQYYQYDANGNRVSDGTYYYEHNAFNQLSGVRLNNATGMLIESYIYDHNGDRVYKQNYITNTTVYYAGREFTRLVNSTGTYDTIYVYDEHSLVARIDVWDNNKTYYYHPDHLGSTTLITDAQGNVVEETTYEPYGSVYSGYPSGSRYLYTGKELDGSTGLYYYSARYYDPNTGQFVQPDKNITDYYRSQSLNRYSYAMNNPYKYIDPSGNVAFIPLIVYGAAIVLPILTESFIVVYPAYQAYVITRTEEAVSDYLRNPTITNMAAIATNVLSMVPPTILPLEITLPATGLHMAIEINKNNPDYLKSVKDSINTKNQIGDIRQNSYNPSLFSEYSKQDTNSHKDYNTAHKSNDDDENIFYKFIDVLLGGKKK